MDEFKCLQCNAVFASSEALGQHKAAKHALPQKKENFFAKPFKENKWKILGLLVLLLTAFFLFGFSKASASGITYPPKLSDEEMHIHATLTIIADGNSIPVPKNVGIGSVHQPLHTHEDDHVIHVESSDTRDYTLGNFFQVWGKRFDSKCVLETCGEVKMTVNGLPNDEYEKHVLRDGEKIVVSASNS
jgi:hypothetical protein